MHSKVAFAQLSPTEQEDVIQISEVIYELLAEGLGATMTELQKNKVSAKLLTGALLQATTRMIVNASTSVITSDAVAQAQNLETVIGHLRSIKADILMSSGTTESIN